MLSLTVYHPNVEIIYVQLRGNYLKDVGYIMIVHACKNQCCFKATSDRVWGPERPVYFEHCMPHCLWSL